MTESWCPICNLLTIPLYFLRQIGIILAIWSFALKKFELISGLKVNMIKSCMVGIHIEDGVLKNLVEVIGCKVRPLKYLGMPPGRNSKAVSFWDPMVKKIAKK